jgi:hypothetical protein
MHLASTAVAGFRGAEYFYFHCEPRPHMIADEYTYIRLGINYRISSSQNITEIFKIHKEYPLNRPGLHHLGPSSHLNKPQNFTLQNSKANDNFSEPTEQHTPII